MEFLAAASGWQVRAHLETSLGFTLLGQVKGLQKTIPSGDVKIAIENGHRIVDLPIENGDFWELCKRLPESI